MRMLAIVKKALLQKYDYQLTMIRLNRKATIKLSQQGQKIRDLLREAILYMLDQVRTKIKIASLSPPAKQLMNQFRDRLYQ